MSLERLPNTLALVMGVNGELQKKQNGKGDGSNVDRFWMESKTVTDKSVCAKGSLVYFRG